MGVVSGRIAEEFYRPTLLVHVDQGIGRGSCRSIPEFDLVAALAECRDMLLHFGGHPMAAGFSVPADKLEDLHSRLLEIARDRLAGLVLEPHSTVDADVDLSSLSGDVVGMIAKFAPFGRDNQVPTFLSRQVRVVDVRAVGAGGEHLKLKVQMGEAERGNVTWHGIGFGMGHLIGEVSPYLDIIYELGTDSWGAEEMAELNILDFASNYGQGE